VVVWSPEGDSSSTVGAGGQLGGWLVPSMVVVVWALKGCKVRKESANGKWEVGSGSGRAVIEVRALTKRDGECLSTA
jgi:hypothetical protein